MRPSALNSSLISAQTLAATLPALVLHARQAAASVAAGLHGRRRAGSGEQFWQYRRAMSGDSLSQIDWRASARSPHLLVREREWEAAQTALIWLDLSPSMNWRSTPNLQTKKDYAQLLILALADLLLRGGERVGWLSASVRPLAGRGILERLALQLTALTPTALPEYPVSLPRHSHFIIVGDFLDAPEQLSSRLRPLLESGAPGILLQVLDPAEVDFTYSGRIRFKGLEQEGAYLAPQAQSLRAQYHSQLAAHTESIQSLLRPAGWLWLRVQTSTTPTQALLSAYKLLELPC